VADKREKAANAIALLSAFGNVVLGKNVQGIWQAELNWLVGRMRPEGHILDHPWFELSISSQCVEILLR